MKTIIAYFSRAGQNYVSGRIMNLSKGNTEIVAEKLKDQLPDAAMFHIDTVKPYSDDYTTCTQEAKNELRNNARPQLKEDFDPTAYDTIILGYPNWWSTMPMAVRTWLDAHDFAGKRVIPYCTHEGSGMGHSENDLKKTLPDAIIEKGTPIYGSSVKNADREINRIVELAKQ